jgi:hypothetical protein
MKFNFNKHLIFGFILIFTKFSIILPLKLKLKSLDKPKFFDQDPEYANSRRIPIININMEDYDSDPINYKRFDGERRLYKERLEELHIKYENEKKSLMNIAAVQLNQIANLALTAESTNELLNSLIPKEKPQTMVSHPN